MEQVNALHTLAPRSRHLVGEKPVNVARRGAWASGVIGNLIVMIGAVIAGGGLWLLLLGGTSYYMLSGIGYVVSGVVLLRRRQAGAWLAVALLAATVAWAVWDAGLNYWAVSPRLFLPAGLALMALLATLGFPANKSWRVAAHTAGVLGLLIGIQFAFAFVPHGVRPRCGSLQARPLQNADVRGLAFEAPGQDPCGCFRVAPRECPAQLDHAAVFRQNAGRALLQSEMRVVLDTHGPGSLPPYA